MLDLRNMKWRFIVFLLMFFIIIALYLNTLFNFDYFFRFIITMKPMQCGSRLLNESREEGSNGI